MTIIELLPARRFLSRSHGQAFKRLSGGSSENFHRANSKNVSFSSNKQCFFSSQNARRRQRRRRSVPYTDVTFDSKLEKKKILFQSLGCPRNFVDTEIMLGISLAEGNMEITQNAQEADVVVVNTCGFLETARNESRTAIQNMIRDKKGHSKLLVTGCMVNLGRQQEEIMHDFPEVDATLPSGDIDRVVETIRRLEDNPVTNVARYDTDRRRKIEHIQNNHSQDSLETSSALPASTSRTQRKSFLEAGETPRFLATPPHYAYLKIAEGCRKQCSFCIIPKLKGRLQSKPVDQVVDEFQAILQHGTAKEVILIAQDLGDYGKDWKSRFGSSIPSVASTSDGRGRGKSHLKNLLEALLESMDNEQDDKDNKDDPFWLRLLYLYPDEITSDLIDLIERDHRVAPYLDLPIQHSHDDILQSMRRKTSSQQIQNTIDLLRQRLPDIFIRTSLMVGFPGETETHFQHLLDFVRANKLDHIGVFMYSNEEMAFSSRLADHVPEEVKQDRYARLMEAQWEVVEQKYQNWVEERKQLRVVIEGLHETDPTRIVGRHSGQCPEIDGQVLLEGHPRVYAGERYWVEVTGYDGYDVVAKVLQEEGK